MSRFDASKIKTMTNYLVAYDLYERNEAMKKIRLKQLTYVFIAILVLVGGTFTVDAMTDNSISNAVKDAFKIKVNDKDYNANCKKKDNGFMECTLDESVLGGQELKFEVDSDYLKNIEVEAKDNDVSITMNGEINE